MQALLAGAPGWVGGGARGRPGRGNRHPRRDHAGLRRRRCRSHVERLRRYRLDGRLPRSRCDCGSSPMACPSSLRMSSSRSRPWGSRWSPRRCSRRSRAGSPRRVGEAAVATCTYAALVTGAQVIALRDLPDPVTRALQTALIAVLIAGPAVAAGIWRAHGAEFGWIPRVPATVRGGLRLGIATVALAMSLAAVTAGLFTYLGRDRIAALAQGLGIDPLGGVALAFGEALYAPNISVWTLGWLSGQGFSVGEGSVYAPGQITTDALPAFPIFGALPTVSGGWLAWAPLAIVGVAALIRVALRRHIPADLAHLPTLGAGIVVTVIGIATLGAIASGALGPGRLSTVDGDAACRRDLRDPRDRGIRHRARVDRARWPGARRRDGGPGLSVVPNAEPAATGS